MLQRAFFILCLLPTLALAESVCLEGPSGGQCHRVDMNGEVFKASRPNTDTQPALERNVANKAKTTPNNTSSANNRRTFRINTAEQRIRQRAQVIEARAQARRNLSANN